MDSSTGKFVAAMARSDSKNHLPRFVTSKSSRGKIIVEMALNELKESSSKSKASRAERDCLTFDFPEFNTVETITNDENDRSYNIDSLEQQSFTNLETIVTSIMPDFADSSELHNNTDFSEHPVTCEPIFPESSRSLIQLEQDAITTCFLEKIDNDHLRIKQKRKDLDYIRDDITDVTVQTSDFTMLEFTDLSEPPKDTDYYLDLSAASNEHIVLEMPQSQIQSEQGSITTDSSQEIEHGMEQKQPDPDYIVENETESTDSSDGDDENFAPIKAAAAKENIDPDHGDKPSKGFTKKGEPRKRRKFENTPDVRRKLKAQKEKQDHALKPGCSMSCNKKCSQNISEERRHDINIQFWDLQRSDRRNFILQNISKCNVARRTIACENQYKRNKTVRYLLKKQNGEQVSVCKIFFLTTLGYRPNQDKMLRIILQGSPGRLTPKHDGRKGKVPVNKIDHLPIIQHIESFSPQISHYRREHAPNRKYLPSDLSVKKMFDSFKQKFPSFTGSYDLYRKILKDQNISFVKLGHEECEDCEYFFLHDENHKKDNLQPDCVICQQWDKHIKKADQSRKRYKEHAEREPVEGEIVFSVDLEKVIMLPRCDMFKSVIFSHRIIAYNESFVPVGTKQKSGIKPVAAIWHDVITGRKKENIISTFYSFFLHHRDEKKIVLWLDNCTAQNKNWAFFSFLVFIVNSEVVAIDNIEVNYFEPGHTYMSADSFHHQVEMSLKRHGKVYDFADFKNAVQNANSSRVVVLEMALENFYEWQDLSSLYKINKTVPRPYVKDIVQVTVCRGNKNLEYKTDFNSPAISLNFLKSTVLKNGFFMPKHENKVNGINNEKKASLLASISKVIPKNRMAFWENLPVQDN